MTTKTLDLYDIEGKIFWTLAIAISLVVIFAVYSFSALTFAAIDRDNMNRASHELANDTGVLEAEYLTETNSITLAYAKNLGFSETDAKFTMENTPKLGMAR